MCGEKDNKNLLIGGYSTVTGTGFTKSGYFTTSGYEFGIIVIYVYNSASTGEEGVGSPD